MSPFTNALESRGFTVPGLHGQVGPLGELWLLKFWGAGVLGVSPWSGPESWDLTEISNMFHMPRAGARGGASSVLMGRGWRGSTEDPLLLLLWPR